MGESTMRHIFSIIKFMRGQDPLDNMRILESLLNSKLFIEASSTISHVFIYILRYLSVSSTIVLLLSYVTDYTGCANCTVNF